MSTAQLLEQIESLSPLRKKEAEDFIRFLAATDKGESTIVRNISQESELLERRRKAKGIWKDRTDLPDFNEVRRSMDRKLNWND